jgi:type III secretion protein V
VAVRPEDAAPGTWTLLVDEIPVASGRAPAKELMILAPPEELSLVGIACRAVVDPLTGRPATVVGAAERTRAEALGPVRDPLQRVLAEVEWALARSAPAFLGIQEAQLLLDGLEPSAPALVREATRQIPPAVLADVLRRLVDEGVSIRPLRTILEAMLEAGGAPRGAPALAEACRRALRRHIGHRCSADGPVLALLLDPAAERAVREALVGDAVALDPTEAAALLDGIEAALDGLDAVPVLLASPDVRRAIRGLVVGRFPRLRVLSCEELPPETLVRPVGRVALAAAA